jgi:hypothetical protein
LADNESVKIVMGNVRKIKEDEIKTKENIAEIILNGHGSRKVSDVASDIYEMVKQNVLKSQDIVPWKGSG